MSYRTEDEAALLREFLEWLISRWLTSQDPNPFGWFDENRELLVAEFMKRRVIV